jgi:hypothetical protein
MLIPNGLLRIAIGLACFTLAPLMAKEILPKAATVSGQIYSHGTIRHATSGLEAVVEVAVELVPNIHEGQQVWMDVRQGHLRGVVKDVHSSMEIVIALDGERSKFKLSRLQPGQAVIAIIQLEEDCDCGSNLGGPVPYL